MTLYDLLQPYALYYQRTKEAEHKALMERQGSTELALITLNLVQDRERTFRYKIGKWAYNTKK